MAELADVNEEEEEEKRCDSHGEEGAAFTMKGRGGEGVVKWWGRRNGTRVG